MFFLLPLLAAPAIIVLKIGALVSAFLTSCLLALGTILATISASTLVVLKILAVFMSIISAIKSVVVLVVSFFAIVSKYLLFLRRIVADVKMILGTVFFIVQVYQFLTTTPDGSPQNTDKRNKTDKREIQPDEPHDELDNGVAKESSPQSLTTNRGLKSQADF